MTEKEKLLQNQEFWGKSKIQNAWCSFWTERKILRKLLHTSLLQQQKLIMILIFTIRISLYHLFQYDFFLFYHFFFFFAISCDPVFSSPKIKHQFIFSVFLCHNQWNSIFNYTTLLWHRTSLTKKLQASPLLWFSMTFLLILIIIIII